MKDVRKNLWPECVHGFDGFKETLPNIQKVLGLAKDHDFEEVQDSGVLDKLKFHVKDLEQQ